MFFWFWRSSLLHYDRHARFLQIWLCLILEGWHEQILRFDAHDGDGFALYDCLLTADEKEYDQLRGYKGLFNDRCNYVQKALERARVAKGSTSP